MKKLKQTWFGKLTIAQMLILLYFTISFIATMSLVQAPWWGYIVLIINLGASSFLLRYVPLEPEDDELR